MSASLHPQPHLNIHQDGARHAEKHHPILRPMNYHLHRRALALATSPVAPTIPDDVVAAAVLHPYHLVALLHQHFLRDDQCTVVRDRVLLRPLPLRPEWRGADDERGDDQSIPAHRPLPISGSASQSCSTACCSSPRRSCRSWRRGRTSQPGTPWCSRSRQTRSEEHTSELQSRPHLVCRLLLEKKKKKRNEVSRAHF